MIIDTHFHAFPGKFLELMPEAKNDVRGVGFHAFDHQEYLNVMDKYGIDMGVLSNTGGRIEKGGDRAKALALCMLLNDGFAEAHAKYPRRFLAFARLPMLDMEDCVRELERCYKDLKMHGVMMPTNVAGKYIDEPEFKLFWDALAAGGKPLFLHPANAPCQANWDTYSLHQKILWPTDSTLALSRIVYAGIFDRYPNLKLIASHLGAMILCYPRPAQLARRRSAVQGGAGSLFQEDLLRHRRADPRAVYQAGLRHGGRGSDPLWRRLSARPGRTRRSVLPDDFESDGRVGCTGGG